MSGYTKPPDPNSLHNVRLSSEVLRKVYENAGTTNMWKYCVRCLKPFGHNHRKNNAAECLASCRLCDKKSHKGEPCPKLAEYPDVFTTGFLREHWPEALAEGDTQNTASRSYAAGSRQSRSERSHGANTQRSSILSTRRSRSRSSSDREYRYRSRDDSRGYRRRDYSRDRRRNDRRTDYSRDRRRDDRRRGDSYDRRRDNRRRDDSYDLRRYHTRGPSRRRDDYRDEKRSYSPDDRHHRYRDRSSMRNRDRTRSPKESRATDAGDPSAMMIRARMAAKDRLRRKPEHEDQETTGVRNLELENQKLQEIIHEKNTEIESLRKALDDAYNELDRRAANVRSRDSPIARFKEEAVSKSARSMGLMTTNDKRASERTPLEPQINLQHTAAGTSTAVPNTIQQASSSSTMTPEQSSSAPEPVTEQITKPGKKSDTDLIDCNCNSDDEGNKEGAG